MQSCKKNYLNWNKRNKVKVWFFDKGISKDFFCENKKVTFRKIKNKNKKNSSHNKILNR
jgi:hypothetical protein